MEDEKLSALLPEDPGRALSEIARTYGGYLFFIAMNILACREDAEECVNDAYAALWKASPPDDPAALRAYLGRTVRNIALDRLERSGAKKRGGEFSSILAELEDCLPSPSTPEAELEKEEIERAISDFLRDEEPACRAVFIRRYWYSDAIADISLRAGMSRSRVKSMLFRMLGSLKKHLEREGIAL